MRSWERPYLRPISAVALTRQQLAADTALMDRNTPSPHSAHSRPHAERRARARAALAGLLTLGLASIAATQATGTFKYEVHDPKRPQPAKVWLPGDRGGTGVAPHDAVILFGGTGTEAWVGGGGKGCVHGAWWVGTKGEGSRSKSMIRSRRRDSNTQPAA